MSFFNKALRIAKNITESFVAQVEKSANEHRQIQQELDSMNDTELINILNDDSWAKSSKKRNVAYGILRKRGHSDKDLNYKQDA